MPCDQVSSMYTMPGYGHSTQGTPVAGSMLMPRCSRTCSHRHQLAYGACLFAANASRHILACQITCCSDNTPHLQTLTHAAQLLL